MNKPYQTIKKFCINPKIRFGYLSKIGLLNFLSDEAYVKKEFKLNMGYDLDLSNPRTFNEKLQWLKLNDRQEKYTTMVDKFEAKKYVGEIIGEEYIIPTIGIYENVNEINFVELPNQFVIKCTHDSGGIIICKDKKKLNIESAKSKINKFLKRKFYYVHREWPYKNVKPRIIIEKYMKDKNSSSMKDYKFFCFNGKPEIMYLSEGLENHKTAEMSFFDMDFNLVDCKRKDYRPLHYKPNKPANFEKMKQFASILSKDIPHVRVDFYEINGKLYFGELTFFTASGYIPFHDDKWNKKLGDMIDLRLVKNNEKQKSNL